MGPDERSNHGALMNDRCSRRRGERVEERRLQQERPHQRCDPAQEENSKTRQQNGPDYSSGGPDRTDRSRVVDDFAQLDRSNAGFRCHLITKSSFSRKVFDAETTVSEGLEMLKEGGWKESEKEG